MKKAKQYQIILLHSFITLLSFSCNNDDIPNNDEIKNCKIHIEGEIKDITNEQLIDSIKVRFTPQLILGDPGPPSLESGEAYTESGQYSLELNCITNGQFYIAVFSDNIKNRYYWQNQTLFLQNSNFQKNIMMCPLSYLSIALKNWTASDSLVYAFSGFQCDNPANEINYSTTRNYSNDTTEVLRMPTSNELNLRLKSYKSGTLQKDTTYLFSTIKGDTTQINVKY